MTDYEHGVRDTLLRISGQIECADNGNEITVDADYFKVPLNLDLNRSIDICWNGVKKQISDITHDPFDYGD